MKIYYGKRLKNPIILENDIYLGYEYYIITLGTHPCCYVLLPKTHKHYGKNHMNIPIRCHYGLTYAEPKLIKDGIIKNGEWVIGWDYAHLGDYFSIDVPFLGDDPEEKKWTVEELREEVEEVIEQL